MYTPERRYALVDRILTRLAAMPAVSAAAFTSELPLTPGGSTARSPCDRVTPRAASPVQARRASSVPRCFAALGMRIVAGRGFAESDTDVGSPVVVVNRAFARRYLGDAPLGARLPMGVGYQEDDAEATVVGVIDDVRY